jgi:hypothetical protein
MNSRMDSKGNCSALQASFGQALVTVTVPGRRVPISGPRLRLGLRVRVAARPPSPPASQLSAPRPAAAVQPRLGHWNSRGPGLALALATGRRRISAVWARHSRSCANPGLSLLERVAAYPVFRIFTIITGYLIMMLLGLINLVLCVWGGQVREFTGEELLKDVELHFE